MQPVCHARDGPLGAGVQIGAPARGADEVTEALACRFPTARSDDANAAVAHQTAQGREDLPPAQVAQGTEHDQGCRRRRSYRLRAPFYLGDVDVRCSSHIADYGR
jgi:hypothetical protein